MRALVPTILRPVASSQDSVVSRKQLRRLGVSVSLEDDMSRKLDGRADRQTPSCYTTVRRPSAALSVALITPASVRSREDGPRASTVSKAGQSHRSSSS